MPVDFTCDKCDRGMRVRDELAGKRIKCPACSAAVTVPDGEEATAAKRSAAVRDSKPAPAPAKRKPVYDEEDEKPRRSSRKGRDEDDDEDEAPRRSSAVRDGKPSTSRSRADEEDEKPSRPRKGRDFDDEEEDDDRFRKKPRRQEGSSLPMILGIGGGLLGLALIGVAVWLFVGRGTNPAPVADNKKEDKKDGDNKGGGDNNGGGNDEAAALTPWVPGDAQLLVSIRVGDLATTTQAKQALDELKKNPQMAAALAEAEKKAGTDFPMPTRVSMVMTNMTGKQGWFICEFSAPVNEAALTARMEGRTEHLHEGKKYYKAFPRVGAPGVCAHFASDKLIVFSPEESLLKQAISSSSNRQKGHLDTALAQLSKRRHVTMGVVPPAAEIAAMQQKAQRNPNEAKYVPLLQLHSITMSMHLGEKDLDLEAALHYPDDARAQAAKAVAAQAVAEGQNQLRAAGAFLPDAKMKPLYDYVVKVVDSVQTAQEGTQLVFKTSADVSQATLNTLLPALGQVPGGAGPFPGGPGPIRPPGTPPVVNPGVSSLKQWVPGNAEIFFSMDAAALLKTTQVKQALTELKKNPGFATSLSDFENNINANFPSLTRMSAVTLSSKEKVNWVVVECSAAINEAQVLTRLGNPAALTHDGKKYYKGSFKPGSPAVFVHFPSDRLCVQAGQEEHLKKAITLSADRQKGPLDDALALLPGGRHVVVGVVPPAAEIQATKLQFQRAAQTLRYVPLLELQSITMTMHLGEKELDIEATVRYPDNAKALAARPVVTLAAGDVFKQLRGMATIADAKTKPLLVYAASVLNNIQTTQNDSLLVVKTKGDVSAETMRVLLASLGQLPGVGGGVGPGMGGPMVPPRPGGPGPIVPPRPGGGPGPGPMPPFPMPMPPMPPQPPMPVPPGTPPMR